MQHVARSVEGKTTLQFVVQLLQEFRIKEGTLPSFIIELLVIGYLPTQGHRVFP